MKKRWIIVFGISLFVLSGCNSITNNIRTTSDRLIEDAILKKANIEMDAEYIEYSERVKNGTIDENGYYAGKETDEFELYEDEEAIHVTFAKNSYINVNYYSDVELREEINKEVCLLHANDCIYAEIQNIYNPNTDSYNFDHFEVWEFDEEGNKTNVITSEFKDSLVFQLPMEYKAKEISIVPLGKYVDKELLLEDFFIDNNNMKQPLAGMWTVNGEETTGNTMRVSPLGSYTVSYKYDSQNYKVVNSEPEYRDNDEEVGIIEFEMYNSTEEVSEFRVELRQKSDEILFDPEKYANEHAKIIFINENDEEIVTPQYLKKGSSITYKIMSIDEEYWTSKKQAEIIVNDEMNSILCNLIHVDRIVRVNIPQPKKGGNIIYTYKGKQYEKEGFIEARVGEEIEMVFNAKNGWSCNYEDGLVYSVIDNDSQSANVKGFSVDDVFYETENRPQVKILANKDISEAIEFKITTADGTISVQNTNPRDPLFDSKVSTKDDLTISLSGGGKEKGFAIKFEISKKYKGQKKAKLNDIQYVVKMPSSILVPLYLENEDTIIEEVEINVSKVSVCEVSIPVIRNAYISINTTDLEIEKAIRAGDVIESDRKVKLMISPKDGYYIEDTGKTEKYIDTIKYSKTDIDKILEKHPVKKYCTVKLDDNDSYGKVSYRIDGKLAEPGIHKLKENQKIELVYEITDNKYIITRNSEGITGLLNKVRSKTKESVEITVSANLSGKTVTREQYIGISEK